MSAMARIFRSPRALTFSLLGLLYVAFAIDLQTPHGWSDWVMYFFVVFLAMRVAASTW